ncbi:DNAJ domain protein [Orobanche minor]
MLSEVNSLLGRESTVSLGKAVDVLDTLGISMTNLNLSSGFASGIATKGFSISILASKVANTVVKGVAAEKISTNRKLIKDPHTAGPNNFARISSK